MGRTDEAVVVVVVEEQDYHTTVSLEKACSIVLSILQSTKKVHTESLGYIFAHQSSGDQHQTHQCSISGDPTGYNMTWGKKNSEHRE